MSTIDLGEFHELSQWRHLTVVHPYIGGIQRFGSHTILRVRLNHHTIHMRETVDVRYVLTAIITGQGREYRSRRYSGTFTYHRVHIHKILREVRVERRISHCNFRTLVQGCQEILSHLEEFVDVASHLVLHVHFETVGHAITGNHRWRHRDDAHILQVGCTSHNLTDNRIDLILVVRTNRPVLQLDSNQPVRRTCTGN